ncbi:MAG TPA: sialidase family protein, partial [Nitrospira sp.]|nr:sialidase family protein [Nitrospira sp.]
MSNIQVTHDTSLDNARSESSLAINPNNTQQIVAGSKKFINYHTYDFTLATSYSIDGGLHWNDSAPFALLPGWTGISDPAIAWDDSGNVFLVGLAFNNPPISTTIGIAVYKSTDGGQTWSAPNLIHANPGDDKQWAAGDGNPGSPFHGRVYAAWDGSAGLCFARTLDHGGTWIGTGASAAGTAIAPSSFSPEVNVADDGTVYIIFLVGSEIKMVKSIDGGNSFQATASPAIGIGAFGITTLPGGNFRVITVPTACDSGSTIIVSWCDNREGNQRIYYAASTNGGTSWNTPPSGQPLLAGLPIDANMFHFHPQIVFRPNGVLGCAFYEFGPKPVVPKIDTRMALSFDNGISFSQLFTVTDQPWDPTVDAPWAHGDPNLTFIGEYFGFDASNDGFYPLWTDTRTGIQELWMDIMPQKTCAFIVERSTLGQDEIDARRAGVPGHHAVVSDAFRVVIDGFTATELGLSATANMLN